MSTLKVSLSGTAAHSYDNRTEAVVFSGDPLVLELHCQAPWNAGEPVTCNMMSDGFVVGVYSGTGNIQIPAEDLTSGQYELFFNQNGSSASGYTATITKVLGSLSDDDMALTLDRNKRIMNTELHMLGVQGDMESEVLDFRFPRYADGVDLSEKIISIHYITFGGNASVDTATNVHTDDEYVYFSWVISSEVTAHVGEVNFAVHCTEVNPEGLLIYSWATQPAKLPVKETVTSIEQIRERNPDAINQWLEIMAKASEALEGYVLGIGPNGVLQWVEQTGGTGGGGTTDHSKLTNRNLANQHSIGAITGLQEALNGKQASGDYALKSEIPTVPTKLSELTEDETHRTVTDVEKQKWNSETGTGVQNASELAATVPEGLTAEENVQAIIDAINAVMLKKTGGTMTGNLRMMDKTFLIFEGVTDAGIQNYGGVKIFGYGPIDPPSDNRIFFKIGDIAKPLLLRGSGNKPLYNGKELSLAGESLTTEQINALDGMFKVCAYIKPDVSEQYNAFRAAFGLSGEVHTTKITLDQTDLKIVGNNPMTLKATIEPPDSTDGVIWLSSEPTVASVLNGTITPKKDGDTIITATSGKQSATCTVNVSGFVKDTPFGVAWTDHIYLSNGKEAKNDTYCASDYIDLAGNKSVKVSSTVTQLFQINTSFYDGDKKYIKNSGQMNFISGTNASFPSPVIHGAPENAKYVRVSTQIQAGSTTAGFVKYTELTYELI